MWLLVVRCEPLRPIRLVVFVYIVSLVIHTVDAFGSKLLIEKIGRQRTTIASVASISIVAIQYRMWPMLTLYPVFSLRPLFNPSIRKGNLVKKQLPFSLIIFIYQIIQMWVFIYNFAQHSKKKINKLTSVFRMNMGGVLILRKVLAWK